MTSNEHVLVVAGEVSGDIHGGNMLAYLTDIRPQVQTFGIGGERLVEEGLEAVATTDELAHMGLVEVVRELPRLRDLMGRVVAEAARRKPRVAVLIDSPDFNLRLARRLQALDVPVVLYVSPQLWAWRRRRVHTVRRLAREVLCILPFEVPFYREHGVAARYVGHPLVDDVARVATPNVDPRPRQLALLPGSRAMEVRTLLPAMLEGLDQVDPQLVSEAVLIEAPGVKAVIDDVLGSRPLASELRRVAGPDRRQHLAASAGAWTASGTATLECALLGVPMVVGYRLQPLSYLLARCLVRVPHVALVNLIARERVAPELIQSSWNAHRLAGFLPDLMGPAGEAQRRRLAVVRDRLGPPGASRRAAEAVAEHLGG